MIFFFFGEAFSKMIIHRKLSFLFRSTKAVNITTVCIKLNYTRILQHCWTDLLSFMTL